MSDTPDLTRCQHGVPIAGGFCTTCTLKELSTEIVSLRAQLQEAQQAHATTAEVARSSIAGLELEVTALRAEIDRLAGAEQALTAAREEAARLREALVDAERFIDPGIGRGPAVPQWQAMRDRVTVALEAPPVASQAPPQEK